jgi:hypothetical protein
MLPTNQQGAARVRAGEPGIFLSWGGAIYGPATAEEVLAGLRTSWFEEDTLYWSEGQEEWRPVAEMSTQVEGGHHTLAGRRVGEAPADAPPLPSAANRVRPAPGSRPHRRHGRKSGSKRRPGNSSRTGGIIIFAFFLLAAALTVGLLVLLMQM